MVLRARVHHGSQSSRALVRSPSSAPTSTRSTRAPAWCLVLATKSLLDAQTAQPFARFQAVRFATVHNVG